ncbi:MAG TPA: hypothetical protein VGB24_00885 [Longimicrobium sp.]|uniref:hypothetical protein n=1 Tax=Longimicrobium sp. TaxID=2029185 RepID=UPI002ED7EB53
MVGPVPAASRGSAAEARLRAAGTADELIEGSLMVAETGAGPGLLLWRALRDVRAWAAAPEPLRPFVFPPAAGPDRRRLLAYSGADERLWAPVCVFICLVEQREPADPSRLLHACRRVSQWASDHGARVTAAAFEACAALVAAAVREHPY